MGHKKKNCAPCQKATHKKDDCNTCHKRPAPKPKEPECLSCKEPECDCRCRDLIEQPIRVIDANLVASTVPGVVASARIELSSTPQYRPKFDVCNRRQVVVSVSPHLIGGTAAQTLLIRGSVFYDNGANDVYLFEESQYFVVRAGEDAIHNYTLRADLDKDRILLIEVLYAAGETPAPGAGVTYVPPVAPANDVNVSIYYSKKYPAKHKKTPVYIEINE